MQITKKDINEGFKTLAAVLLSGSNNKKDKKGGMKKSNEDNGAISKKSFRLKLSV